MRTILLVMACSAVLAATAGQARAGVMITYKDVGANLQFDYSGTLGLETDFDKPNRPSTVGMVPGAGAVFFSGQNVGFAFEGPGPHTPGPFATNLPVYSDRPAIVGTHSGTSLYFELHEWDPEFTYMYLSGDWGRAYAPIDGRLTLFGQSAASLGMVDGWTLQADWGSITFQAATPTAASSAHAPEPSSFAVWALGMGVAAFATGRRRPRPAYRALAA